MQATLRIQDRQLLDWHRAAADFIDAGFATDALPPLLGALQRLVDGSGQALIVYPPGGAPLWPCPPDQGSRLQIDRYVEGAYLLDPWYRLALEQRVEGVLRIAEAAPTGFRQSEFYRRYYRDAGLRDEACLIVQAPDDRIILVSLSRHRGEAAFAPRHKALLEPLFPLLRTLLLRWWRAREPAAPVLQNPLDRALAHFGTSVLTAREAEILQLTLRGHSVKSLAQKLGLSPETVKHHRKRIFAKLDIGSQAELFHLFIDALRGVTPDSPADPLVGYLGPGG